MDDAAQKPVQGSTQPLPVPQPVGSVQKETGPVASEPFIAASGAEVTPAIPQELSEHGVEAVGHHEAPQVTEEHRQIGVEPAKESVPVTTTPSGVVTLPMTEEEAKKTLKMHKKVGDSILWLASLIVKHAKMVHEKIIAKQ